MLKKKFPDVSQSTIGMCLETSHYSISMAESRFCFSFFK